MEGQPLTQGKAAEGEAEGEDRLSHHLPQRLQLQQGLSIGIAAVGLSPPFTAVLLPDCRAERQEARAAPRAVPRAALPEHVPADLLHPDIYPGRRAPQAPDHDQRA